MSPYYQLRVCEEKLNTYYATAINGVFSIHRYTNTIGPVNYADLQDSVATSYAEVYGQDGDIGTKKEYEIEKMKLDKANHECMENHLPTAVFTENYVEEEVDAYEAAAIIEEAHETLTSNQELTSALLSRVEKLCTIQEQETELEQ